MWSPQICLFLVVTPLLVCAAPAAQTALSVENESIQQHLVNVESEDLTVKRSAKVDSLDSTVKRSARIDSFLAIPSTGFTCSAQAVPGIYADQETDCQVFHYCQDGGRMDSFFCPNLTLFNQQYFVCDWEYNVDCNSAHQYFSLNEALYKTPEKIYQAINPAIKIGQNELLQGAASSEVSRTLNSLVSKLDSRTSAIVVDSALSPTLLAQQTKTRPFPEVKTDRESKSLTSLKDLSSLDAEREGKSFDSGLSSYGPSIIPSDDQIATTIVQTGSTPVSTVTISSVIKDVPTTSILYAGQSSDDIDNAYDDAVADPEPDCYYSGSCGAAGASSGSYTAAAAAGSSGGYATDAYNTAGQSSDALNNAYDDAVADPEPDCFYSGNCGTAGASSGTYSVIDSSSPDAYNTAGQSSDIIDNAYNDAIADPEPDCYYSGNCGTAGASSGTYSVIDSSSPDAYNSAQTNYADDGNNAYDDAVADPEPAGYYSGNSAAAGASSGSYSVIDNSNYGSQSQGTVPSYADAVNSVYDPYDSSDPEPSAIPYSTSGSYGQYDSADPEPDSYYGYYDSADPEPASFYGANTIDLSASSQASYQSPSSSQYSNSDPAATLTVDYDDASADPEPDPSSYGSDINLYDSSVSDYQQPSYKSYTPSNAINDYYKGYPSQGLVVDSPDPEPSADPEFTPYGE